MNNYRLHFVSYKGKGRDIAFTITIEAASCLDANTVGHRMGDSLGCSFAGAWQIIP